MIQAVDSHTAGEPTRVVTGGLPQIAGATMAAKRDVLECDHDHLRRALVLEPRGHDAIIVAYLLPPTREDADLGVVFANDAGYLGMCGHGAIGLATTAVATGMVATVEPVTTIRLDTTVGLVECKVHVANGKPQSVTITNVPSFLYRQRALVPVHGFGKVAVDIAYGGNWFAFVEAEQLGLMVEKAHLPVLLQAATAIRESMVREGIRGVHPDLGVEQIIDHVKLFVPLDGERPGARSLTLCPGTAYDRSPCGTGTSAKLAVLHAKGELGVGEWFDSDSVLGTRFRARVLETTRVGEHDAVVPEITGSAWITSMATFVIDPDDPCRYGI
ncbi:MAG: proline racemase family protein [Planctomycetes bacterium]|nr:proline racemase family protein [Planctomycetota bacterium]